MKLQKIIIITTLLSSLLSATVYSDGEDGTNGWRVYDNKPAGAIVSNIFDEEKNSNVIEFKGEGRLNAYLIGSKRTKKAWNNSEEHVLKWSMNFSEKFRMAVYLKSKKGQRVLLYDYKNSDKGFYKKKYIRLGLGDESRSGKWIDISRDLEADLKKYEPDNSIVTVNAFKVQGSGKIDNLELTNQIKNEQDISPIIKMAKEQCLGKNDSTEEVFCSTYNNIVYVIKNEYRDPQSLHIPPYIYAYFYTVDITPKHEKIKYSKMYNLTKNSADDGKIRFPWKLENTSLCLFELVYGSTDIVGSYVLHNGTKELLKMRYSEMGDEYKSIKTFDNGRKLEVKLDNWVEEKSYRLRLVYDITNLNEVKLISKEKREVLINNTF